MFDLLPRLDGKTVLVTGAGGFVGGAVCRRLAESDCRIIRMSRRELPPLPARGEVVNLTAGLEDVAVWSDALAKADVLIHLAANTSLYEAEKDPLFDLEVNGGTMASILRAARDAGHTPHIVAASTVTLAGLTHVTPVDEAHPADPMSFYDLSKYTAENYLKLGSRLGWVTGASLRLANIYGPGSTPQVSERGVLNKVTRRAWDGLDALLFGHGRYLRDFVYIDDLVEAFIRLAALPERVDGGPYIIASGEGVFLRDAFELAVNQVALRTGRRVSINQIEPPPNLSPIEYRDFVGNPAKLMGATGWRPTVALDEGISRLIDSFG